MRKSQKNKGITLIALIITIIVLLILAGVSISLVVGDNGVLTQSKRASSVTQEKTAKEEVELAYSAVISAYYEGYATNASLDKWEYVTEPRLSAELSGTGSIVANTFTKDNETREITFTYHSDGKNTNYDITITSSGKVEILPSLPKYSITYNANTGSGSMNAGNKTEGVDYTIAANSFTAPSGKVFKNWNTQADGEGTSYSAGATYSTDADLTLYAQWKDPVVANRSYGDPVATGTEAGTYGTIGTSVQLNGGSAITVGSGSIADNWKVFYEDADFVYLIYGDYYPVNVQTNSDLSTIGFGGSYTYAVLDNNTGRANLLKYLRNNSAYTWDSSNMVDNYGTGGSTYTSWTNLQTALSGLTSLNNKTIAIQGSPDMELWVKSWNAKGNTALKTDKAIYGYKIGLSSGTTANTIDLSSYTSVEGKDYNDALYFPYKTDQTTAWGYWLASPNADSSNLVCLVYSGGGVNYADRGYPYFCVRPLVSIAKQ